MYFQNIKDHFELSALSALNIGSLRAEWMFIFKDCLSLFETSQIPISPLGILHFSRVFYYEIWPLTRRYRFVGHALIFVCLGFRMFYPNHWGVDDIWPYQIRPAFDASFRLTLVITVAVVGDERCCFSSNFSQKSLSFFCLPFILSY